MPQVPSPSAVLNHPEIMGTLAIMPKGLTFQTQNKGERVYIKTRPHPLVNIGWITNFTLLAILPGVVYLIFNAIPLNLDFSDFIPNAFTLVVVLLAYYSILLTYFLFNFIDWYYDIYLVTNERILNIEFEPIRSHRISEANLRNIEDVSESVIGVLPSLFNYGDVKVQTAARQDLFVFKAVPDPAWFRDVIVDLARFTRGGNA